jgi:hypothetical protein
MISPEGLWYLLPPENPNSKSRVRAKRSSPPASWGRFLLSVPWLGGSSRWFLIEGGINFMEESGLLLREPRTLVSRSEEVLWLELLESLFFPTPA